ncbi:MAG: hypothetical protein ACRDZ4_03640 [Egibacteraceae bacterium]
MIPETNLDLEVDVLGLQSLSSPTELGADGVPGLLCVLLTFVCGRNTNCGGQSICTLLSL